MTIWINIALEQNCKCMLLSVSCECELFLIFSDWDRKKHIHHISDLYHVSQVLLLIKIPHLAQWLWLGLFIGWVCGSLQSSFKIHSFSFFKSIFYWLCFYSCPNFSPFPHSTRYPLPSSNAPTYFMSIGHTYKFFGFSISCIVLNTPRLFCTYQICFLIPIRFSPFFLFPCPTDNPPCDLHFCDSVPVLVVCLVCFCFFRFSFW